MILVDDGTNDAVTYTDLNPRWPARGTMPPLTAAAAPVPAPAPEPSVPALPGQVSPEQLAAWTLSWIKQIYPLDSDETARFLSLLNTALTGSATPQTEKKTLRRPGGEPKAAAS